MTDDLPGWIIHSLSTRKKNCEWAQQLTLIGFEDCPLSAPRSRDALADRLRDGTF